jgi:predicted nucleotidyltransferase
MAFLKRDSLLVATGLVRLFESLSLIMNQPTSDNLEQARSDLLGTAVESFKANIDVLAVFLGGSMAAGRADAYSDIDLRVVVKSERHSHFVLQRREIPKRLPGFLFNEWVPNAQHCVSHFEPFVKMDIFYYDATALTPSPWYRLPIKILHDPKGIVADLVKRSEGLTFTVQEDHVDYSISKGLAAAHETYRRAKRGELFYAQTLMDELRHHMMQADDWLHDRTAETTVMAKFDKRATGDVLAVLKASYCQCEGDAILAVLFSLVRLYRNQVLALHEKFGLSRSLDNDVAAIELLE